MPLAIARQVSARFAECELTHIQRQPIDIAKARAQHAAYVRALQGLGCHVVELPAEDDLPDSVFVEDAAFILPEVAVVTRPGADSRKPETVSVADALRPHRDLLFVHEPATIDGGDVLVLDRDIYVGLSSRTNTAALQQLQSMLGRYGYRIHGVAVGEFLHLKSAVTRLDEETLLLNPRWVDATLFGKFKQVEVAPSEPMAANILVIRGAGLYPNNFPETQARIEAHGAKVITLDVSELAKAEGAVTCCSLILQ
ncbi:MAG: dimethylarginine dimethylaminohydrolase family protein [Chloroflexota bacterium]